MLWNDKRTPAGHVTDTQTGVTAPMGTHRIPASQTSPGGEAGRRALRGAGEVAAQSEWGRATAVRRVA